jgi:hypothetical protein
MIFFDNFVVVQFEQVFVVATSTIYFVFFFKSPIQCVCDLVGGLKQARVPVLLKETKIGRAAPNILKT